MRFSRIVMALGFGAGMVLTSPAVAQTSAEPREPAWLEFPIAVLQGLDKITARISTFEIPVDQTGRFGTFLITPRACRQRPPTETPESAAFMEIDEQKPDEEQVRLFTGWMFASSPALNAVEHPVYDVWLLDCKSASTKGQSSVPE
ncbi:DUF2155 domain-containing protein [Nisaea acidiphila]|uniref:DUF2155 domain-containing protein n=1 Tax=Nisaea acidiphila TaxID=1862145 RepID=A0A9J7APM7_9PROT|nr:DUF2155 domain-containing protein [Nisaea acidiphila]UUX49167.1 DUF2155 domain-containing protein [Nisaea acidiphila]